MLVLGLVVGVGAFAILQLSQEKMDNARLNFGPDEYAGTVMRCWILTSAGLLAALIGAALVSLNPDADATAKATVNPPAATSSIENRLATVCMLLDEGSISDDEYREQRRRILDQT